MGNEVNRFGLTLSSVALGTQPSAAFGTAVTPGNLAYGSFVQVPVMNGTAAATSDDSCEVEIGINTVGIPATARDCLVRIGWDPAGGTAYGVAGRTSIDHLIGSCASAYMAGAGGLGGGVVYRFPLRIPAGSTLAAQAMVNSATVTAINVYAKLRGRPSHPHRIYVGTFVDTYGAVLATAAGTSITPGTAARGAFVSVGALALTYSYFELGLGCNDATMANLGYEVDVAVGDGSNKDLVVEGATFTVSNAETITKQAGNGRYARVGTASTLFVRAQASTTPDSNVSAAVYAVGG
jgi:hypothetical protein